MDTTPLWAKKGGDFEPRETRLDFRLAAVCPPSRYPVIRARFVVLSEKFERRRSFLGTSIGMPFGLVVLLEEGERHVSFLLETRGMFVHRGRLCGGGRVDGRKKRKESLCGCRTLMRMLMPRRKGRGDERKSLGSGEYPRGGQRIRRRGGKEKEGGDEVMEMEMEMGENRG